MRDVPAHMMAPAEQDLIHLTASGVGQRITPMLQSNCNTPVFEVTPIAVPSSLRAAVVGAALVRNAARGGLSPWASRRLREYVSAHLDGKIRVQALASLVGLSKFHFCRVFKQSEGLTPLRFVLKCRVERAAHLLASTDLPVSSIAFAAGFADQSHLSCRFRELIGLTPRRYRRLMR
jgi:AraC family transcriptional regulator